MTFKINIIGVIVLLTGMSVQVNAEKASDAAMALSALESTVRSSNGDLISQLVRSSSQDIARLSVDPATREQPFYAEIVLAAGKSPIEIEIFADKYHLDIVTAEIKYAVGDSGRVVTFSLGADELLMLSGTLSEKITKASGGHKLMLANLISSSDDQASFELFEAVTSMTDQVYKMSAIGLIPDIERALADGEIAIALPDISGNMLQSTQSYRERYSGFQPDRNITIRIRPGQNVAEEIERQFPGAHPVFYYPTEVNQALSGLLNQGAQ